MSSIYDSRAPKRAANLRINADLLHKAKAMDINLSATLERALVEAIKSRLRSKWENENRPAIQAYNELIEQHGGFSDGLRTF